MGSPAVAERGGEARGGGRGESGERSGVQARSASLITRTRSHTGLSHTLEFRVSHEGMVTEEKRKKTKIIFGTQSKAQAGWPKRLRLLKVTP